MKYILTAKQLKNKILVEFTTEGLLCKMEISSEDATEKFVRWFLGRLPWHEKAMSAINYQNLLKIEPVADNLSFDGFWDAYNYKVGKKPRVQKLWDAMSDPDRAKAIAGVKRYDGYLSAQKGIAKAYAETYLRNRYWENEY